MKTVHLVIGTRPEAIKMAPVYRALQQKHHLDVKLISTGQHRELLKQTLSAFELQPFHHLDVMMPGQSLSSLTARLLTGLESLFAQQRPDLVLAHGDTTTCYSTALSAFYHSIPFFHVEAGLRTHLLDSPYPEEFNRQYVAQLADHHFAPTEAEKQNLLQEGVDPRSISVIGSTEQDAIRLVQSKLSNMPNSIKHRIAPDQPMVLITVHRRENGNQTLKGIMGAIRQIARDHKEMAFVFPVHPNPKIKDLAQDLFSSNSNILLTESLSYPEFLSALNRSMLVLTDSGGVQEEAAFFKKRTLILRDITERSDGLARGSAILVGTDPTQIVARLKSELSAPTHVPASIPPSDLQASQIIADYVSGACFA